MTELSSTKPRSTVLSLLRAQSALTTRYSSVQADGIADDIEPFPFLAIVGQDEMKLALMLAVVNPLVGGVLLLGPRGTAKTTAVRALTDLLPMVDRSFCDKGCTDAQFEAEGMVGVCKDCAKKAGYNEPLSSKEKVRIVELPLNARMDDVVGGVNERLAVEQNRIRLERGLLSQAHGNVLFIDEVNLLEHSITNAILDAAAQGRFTVRRGVQKVTYESEFMLVGSMNPEEGALRPQIMDRFGLRVVVRGLNEASLRFRAYQQAVWYRRDPAGLASTYAEQTLLLAQEIEAAQQCLANVKISKPAIARGVELVQKTGIESGRAEITLFESARAYAACDERVTVIPTDIMAVAPMCLRLRKSDGLQAFLSRHEAEEAQLQELLSE